MSDLVEDIINEDGVPPLRHRQAEKRDLVEASQQLLANILSGMEGAPPDFDVMIDGKWARFHAEWDRVRNPGNVYITAPSGAKATFTLNLK